MQKGQRLTIKYSRVDIDRKLQGSNSGREGTRTQGPRKDKKVRGDAIGEWSWMRVEESWLRPNTMIRIVQTMKKYIFSNRIAYLLQTGGGGKEISL